MFLYAKKIFYTHSEKLVLLSEMLPQEDTHLESIYQQDWTWPSRMIFTRKKPRLLWAEKFTVKFSQKQISDSNTHNWTPVTNVMTLRVIWNIPTKKLYENRLLLSINAKNRRSTWRSTPHIEKQSAKCGMKALESEERMKSRRASKNISRIWILQSKKWLTNSWSLAIHTWNVIRTILW